VRVTSSPHGGVVVDGASDGRGAWLCRATTPIGRVDAACRDQALARRAFERAWKRPLGAADQQALREQVARDDDEDPDAH
jgi:predicted RNA-binding protein YlxR (DUF448 family)